MAEFNGLKGSPSGNYMKNVVHSSSSGSKVWRRSIKSVRESTSSTVSSSPGRFLPERHSWSWSSRSKAKNHSSGRDCGVNIQSQLSVNCLVMLMILIGKIIK